MIYSGNTPGVGSFVVRRDDTEEDYCIMIQLADGIRVERWTTNYERVFEILQEYNLLHSLKIGKD